MKLNYSSTMKLQYIMINQVSVPDWMGLSVLTPYPRLCVRNLSNLTVDWCRWMRWLLHLSPHGHTDALHSVYTILCTYVHIITYSVHHSVHIHTHTRTHRCTALHVHHSVHIRTHTHIITYTAQTHRRTALRVHHSVHIRTHHYLQCTPFCAHTYAHTHIITYSSCCQHKHSSKLVRCVQSRSQCRMLLYVWSLVRDGRCDHITPVLRLIHFCFIKIQNCFTFLVLAYPDCPGKEAVTYYSRFMAHWRGLSG